MFTFHGTCNSTIVSVTYVERKLMEHIDWINEFDKYPNPAID